jgi:hypothetical protein
MNLSKQTTSKLYYGKWPFKLKIEVSGAWMVKRKGVDATIAYCKEDSLAASYLHKNINRSKLLEFTNIIHTHLDKDIHVRVEGRIFSIYCKDRTLFETISKDCAKYVVAEYEPASDIELEYMTSNSAKKVLCNHIPFNQYPYKVYIKYNMPRNTRAAFKKWVENYEGKIKVVSATHNWLNGLDYYNALIIYVADRPTLSMVGMFLGSSISKVEEFIPRSSINTSLEQEETCQL